MLVSLYGFILRKKGETGTKKGRSEGGKEGRKMTVVKSHTHSTVGAMGKGVFECFFFLLLILSKYLQKGQKLF